MIKVQMDFKEKSLTVFIAFAAYLAVEVLLGKALGNSNTLFLLKTILAFALVGLIWQLLMKVNKEGNGKRAADGQLQVLKENFELKAVSIVKATPDEVLSALKDHVNRRVWDSGC